MLPRSLAAAGIITAAVLLPVSAAAQKDAFVAAFIDFHSALSGTYGDEGTQALAALDRMATSLAAWEQSLVEVEAGLKARAGTTQAEFALLYANQGRFDAAIAAMAGAIAAEPTRASLYVQQGLLQEAGGHRSDAALTFAVAAKRDPADPVAAYLATSLVSPAAQTEDLRPLVAVLTAAAGRRSAAPRRASFAQFGLINDLASLVPVFSPASYAEGFALFTRGRYRDAVTYFRTALAADPLVIAPRDERARVTLGSTLAEAGRLADAERVLRETVTALPSSGHARWVLADVYERLNRGLDAIAILEEAASLPVVAGKTRLYFRIATLAHRHQDHDRVVTALTRRARLVPNAGPAHKDLGLAYARLGRDDAALIELLMTTLLGVEDAETLAAIGQIHLAAERFDDAERTLRRAVALDAKNARARYALGTTLMRLDQVPEGQQQLDQFRRLRAAALAEQQRLFEKESKPARPLP